MTDKEILEELELHKSWFDYSNFYDLVASQKSFKRYVEIGVWKGNSISYLANLLRDKKGVEIYAVDLFENSNYSDVYGHISRKEIANLYEVYNYNLKRNNVRHLIKDIKGCSWETASQFENNYFDFIFIDAGHLYQDVINDIKAWLPKIRQNGIFAGHDWLGGGIRKAVHDMFSKKSINIYPPQVWSIQL